jgi:hypothetical protein
VNFEIDTPPLNTGKLNFDVQFLMCLIAICSDSRANFNSLLPLLNPIPTLLWVILEGLIDIHSPHRRAKTLVFEGGPLSVEVLLPIGLTL